MQEEISVDIEEDDECKSVEYECDGMDVEGNESDGFDTENGATIISLQDIVRLDSKKLTAYDLRNVN